MSAYTLKGDRIIGGAVYGRKGDVVFDCKGWDYGCANDDTRVFDVRHQSVTLDPSGGYPFFTVPSADLEPLDLSDAALGIVRNSSDEIVSVSDVNGNPIDWRNG